MVTKVNLPKSGMGIEEATLLRWLKKEGDSVHEGETLVEAETAKATVDIAASVSGILVRILVGEGETVEVNTAIALIDEGNAGP
jgi:pyruvate/2-oxoglutarate dehydrogenase complex dihydrolipoamide acyltransferase (E2) component